MIDFDKLKQRKEAFARATGVKLEIFYEMVEKVRPFWDKLQRSKLCHGRNSKLKNLENEILLVLFYYRCYVSHLMLGACFDLDASNVCRHLKVMEPLLAKAIHIKKNRVLPFEELDKILIDATEIQTQRPTRKQRKYYSGKKKKHTQKLEIIVSKIGKIFSISRVHPGRVHDFLIRKKSDKIPMNVEVLADSGYQGLQNTHKNTTLPYKRPPKKPEPKTRKRGRNNSSPPKHKRKSPLIREQRRHNHDLASQRIVVEHVFAKLKKFKILSSVYRNFQKKLHMRFNIIAGIYNLGVA